MHSAIFELSKQPIEVNDRITSEDIIESFNWISDYWSTDSNRGWLESLAAVTEGYATVGNGMIRINRERLKKEIAYKLDEVKYIISRCTDVDDFVRFRYRIQSRINDRFQFYIKYEGELITFDDFLANLIRFSDDEEFIFYIGGVIDYHC